MKIKGKVRVGAKKMVAPQRPSANYNKFDIFLENQLKKNNKTQSRFKISF